MRRLGKAKWCLLGCLVVILGLIVTSALVPGRLTNAVRWVADNDIACRLRGVSRLEMAQELKPVEMVVETVGVGKLDFQPVVILKEKSGELRLPIWIGLLEANAISVVLEGVAMPRPLTSDLLCTTIDRMGASVDYIVIHDLKDHTFYASIALKANRGQLEIDARPSDAIAVALRTKVPIYVAKTVLDKAGIQPQEKADKYT